MTHRAARRASTTALLLAALAAAPAPAADHAPRAERVPDFGRLVPRGEIEPPPAGEIVLERVTTAVPWARGMTLVDGELVVLSRGRHRGDGGVARDLVDHAGTLWRVDVSASERVVPGAWAGEAVRRNATVLARPTDPPIPLYDRARPPEDDLRMARPFCALAYDEGSRSLFVCAYAGAELPAFRKHATDAVYRYDLRDGAWHVVEQHDPSVVPRDELGAVISNVHYPHHDPTISPPPHGWLNGPIDCVGAGRFLYVPAKDNHLVVQYDLDAIRRDPSAGPPPSRPVLGSSVLLVHPRGVTETELLGPGCVATDGRHLYLGYRTSSVVVRVGLDGEGDVVREPDGRVRAELVAVFEPWDPVRQRSGNLYDIDLGPSGELYVSMGTEGRVWRVDPDPARPFYGNDQTDRPTTAPPLLDMSALLGRPTGCNNVMVDRERGWLYVSSRGNDTGTGRLHGTVYRVRLDDG